MPNGLRRPFLLVCLLLATFLPLAGGWLHWHGLPPGYGLFPPQHVQDQPGFNALYFWAGVGVVAIMILFLLFPRLFGFKPVAPEPDPGWGKLPGWFWPGVGVMLASWGAMWFGQGLIARFSFVPLWWGFIYALDGLVYARQHGRSIVRDRKHEMLILAMVSMVGWYVFEYWNYFVVENWYYPYANLLSPFGNLVWYSLSYTTVWPACFEWYMLLATIPAIRQRWSDGPAIRLGRGVWAGVLLLGFGLSFAMGVWPYFLFWALWIGSLLSLLAALELSGFWTPFDPGGRGDWSRLIMMGLATFFNGYVWEFWNYGSQAFRHGVPTNPNYWIYDIPYMNVIHLFSEMPFLGYFGYLFFGVLVWVYWLVVAHLIEIDPDFAHQDVLTAQAQIAARLAEDAEGREAA
jgi:hypothetical protein